MIGCSAGNLGEKGEPIPEESCSKDENPCLLSEAINYHDK